jgi:predicted nucleic-acid-binding protein
MRLPAKVPSQRVHQLAIPQAEVAQALLALVTARGVQLDEQAIVVAVLEHARDVKDVDFVDAYVAAKAAGDGLAVASFDKALHKKLGTTIFPP